MITSPPYVCEISKEQAFNGSARTNLFYGKTILLLGRRQHKRIAPRKKRIVWGGGSETLITDAIGFDSYNQ